MDQKKITRAAFLLAITIVFQSLRIVFPLPTLMTTILVGTLVNACLLIAVETVGLIPALLIAIITPIIAFFQSMLVVPIFILPIAAGNILYQVIFYLFYNKYKLTSIIAASFCKTSLLFISFYYLLKFIAIPVKAAGIILFIMSWPQLFTGLVGGIISNILVKKIKNI